MILSMKRLVFAVLLAIASLALASPAYAGSPHFVGSIQATLSGETLTVSGKVAGLGNEEQIDVQVSATVACVNRGNHQPGADNKETFGAGGQFPVQNGKAEFEVAVPIVFQPDCSPPMRLVLLSGVVTVQPGDLVATF